MRGLVGIPPGGTPVVFVAYELQSRIVGDIRRMPADLTITKFWRVLAGAAPGCRCAEQVTAVDSVGFALGGYCARTFLRKVTLRQGLGRDTGLIARRSERRAGLLQELGLLGRGAAPEDGVAVRKAAEAPDHLGMPPRIVLIAGQRWLGLHQRPKQAQRLGLRHTVLRVLERQVDKHPPQGPEPQVSTARYQGLRASKRPGVASTGTRAATKYVAGELVQQQQPGQRGGRLDGPPVQLAYQRRLDQAAKPRTDALIEGRILAEPFGARVVPRRLDRTEPAGQHGSCVRRNGR